MVIHLHFFVQRFEARTDAIEPYNEETKKRYGTKCKTKAFAQGMWEIENDPELKLLVEKDQDEEDETEPPATSSESDSSAEGLASVKDEKLFQDGEAEKKPAAKARPEPVRSSKRLRPTDEQPAVVPEKVSLGHLPTCLNQKSS